MSRATTRRESPPSQLALAMVASILLHLTLLAVLQPALPPQEERFSEHVIEVTLERALAAPAAPSPPAATEAGQARPPGSIDLVHTAPAPGPTDFALQEERALSESPAEPTAASWRPAEAARLNAAIVQELRSVASAPEPAAGAPSVAVRAPDTSNRVQAPPLVQPQRQAVQQALRQSPAAPSASPGTGAPGRRTDNAAHASQHDAEQDYVMQVVRKLAQAQFSTEAEPNRSPRGALIARLTVDRDGNLVGLSLAKDSGSASVDRGILDKVRKSAPFAPLPKSLAASSFSFIVPIRYAQEP